MYELNKISKVFFLFAGLTFICSCKKNNNFQPPEKVRHVYVSKAIKRNVPEYVHSFGYLTASRSVDILSQVTGQILKYHFRGGQYVKKGDLLFSIVPDLYESQLQQAMADLKQKQNLLKFYKDILHRDNSLQAHGAMATQDYYKLLVQYKNTISDVAKDKEVIRSNKIQLDYCSIKSPINGVTGVIKIDPGNIVQANSGPALVNVKTIDPLYLDFTIPEKNFSRLQSAMEKNTLKVMVFVDNIGSGIKNSNKMYEGRIQYFDNSINYKTGTIFLRAVISNKERKLWPGQFVSLYLILENIKDATLVPYSSVNSGLKGDYLFVVDNNSKAKLVYVEIGEKKNDYMVLKSKNIKPGEKVVTVGQMGLTPGVKVKIIKEEKFEYSKFIKKNKINNKLIKSKGIGKKSKAKDD